MSDSRSGYTPTHKFALLTSFSAVNAFAFGFYQSARFASLQYLAEHAHNLPTTHQGWYFYHKTKNYRVVLKGIQGGTRLSLILTTWVASYSLFESLLDKFVFAPPPGFLSSLLSGLTTSTVLGLVTRLPRHSFRRGLLIGGIVGTSLGTLQRFHLNHGAETSHGQY